MINALFTKIPDPALISPAQHDDSTAVVTNSPQQESDQCWGLQLERYRAYLTLLADMQLRRRLKIKADAADIVQETFLIAWQKRSQFRGNNEETFAGWIRSILATQLAMHVRRYHYQSRNVQQEILMGFLEDSRHLALWTRSSDSPSRQASLRESALHVSDALMNLPPDYRLVLVYRHFEERSFREIADLCRRSVSAVTMLYSRALMKMQEALRE